MSTLLYLLVIALALPFRTEQCEESSSSSSSSRSSSTSRMGETRTDTITPLGETTSPAVPTETPTEVESTLSPFCTSVFDNIGPFCQLVVEDDGECRLEVSDSTCDSCRNVTATCGLFNGDICLSNLVSSCPAGPQSDAFLEEFCTVVLRNCTGLLNLGGLVLAAPADHDGVSGDGMHPETEQPPTMLPPSPLVDVESLTTQQRENLVTVAFTGITAEQFIEDGITAFREEVAAIVNTRSSNSQRVKRQQATVTSDDVIVLDSPFVHEGELLVPFVVGQSAPVSESVLTDLLHTEGPRLAAALATAMEVPVQFARVVGFTPPTPSPIPPPSSAGPSERTTAGSSPSAEMQQEGGLAEHAVVGLVLTGLLVIVVVAMVLIGFAAYSGVKTVRHDTRNVKLSVARSTNLIAVRAASVAAAEEGGSGLGSKRQSRLSLNVIGTDSVAMTTTSVSVDVHPTGEQSTTL